MLGSGPHRPGVNQTGPQRWMGGRVVEGTGLENRQGFIALRGFESHPIRHPLSLVFGFAKNVATA